jgi:hypothetical protein
LAKAGERKRRKDRWKYRWKEKKWWIYKGASHTRWSIAERKSGHSDKSETGVGWGKNLPWPSKLGQWNGPQDTFCCSSWALVSQTLWSRKTPSFSFDQMFSSIWLKERKGGCNTGREKMRTS